MDDQAHEELLIWILFFLAVEKLPREELTVFYARELGKMTFKKIGSMCGVSRGRAHQIWLRSNRRLRSHLRYFKVKLKRFPIEGGLRWPTTTETKR